MIKDNVPWVRKRILAACLRVERDIKEITLVAVTKGRSAEQIKEAIAAGISDIAENKVQEALVKYAGLRELNPKLRTHMVGHLQSNKVRSALKLFDLLQSVDSINLALQIDKEAAKINEAPQAEACCFLERNTERPRSIRTLKGAVFWPRMYKIQDILIEVKTSPEATKFGLKPDDTLEVIKEISKLKNINIKGLMTIAPLVDNPQESRPYFRILRELRDEINKCGIVNWCPGILSMGMTDDFEVAIEEGSNMVRLGRAIFEG